MTTPLPRHYEPVHGESAISFVENLAAANFVPLRAIVEVVSKNHVPGRWNSDAWHRLADISRVDLAKIERMSRPSARILSRPDVVLLLGQPIRADHIHTRSLRVCPACMAEERVIPDHWNIAHAPACTRHGILLRETCDCGKTLLQIHRGQKHFSCRCGRTFASLETRTAPTAVVRCSEWLIAKVTAVTSATSPPEAFRDLRLGDLAAVIDLLGHAACTPAADDRHFRTARSGPKRGDTRGRRNIETAATHIEAAVSIIENWPTAYHDLLDQVAWRSGSNADRLFATSIGRTLVRPPFDLRGDVMPCLDQAMSSFLESRNLPRQRNAGLRQRKAVFRQVLLHRTKKALAAEVGQMPNGTEFMKVLRETTAAFEDHGHHRSEDLDAEFVKAFHERWREHMSTIAMDVASRHLDHPRIGRDMKAWIHPELLTPVPDGTERHSRRRHASFRKCDVFDLRRRLAEVALHVDAPLPDHVAYPNMVKTLYGGGYTKTDFLLDVYSRRIRTCSLVAEPRLSDLFFHHADGLDRCWAFVIGRVIAEDRFWIKHRISAMMKTLWPQIHGMGQQYGFEFWGSLRSSDQVRRKTLVNTSEGRTRPFYHYSLTDSLRFARSAHGVSISPTVDMLLDGLTPRDQ